MPNEGRRQTWGLVSGSEQHFSRVVRAGNLVFLSGNAFDGDGHPLPGSVPPPPYQLSDSAICVFQTRALYDEYTPVLQDLGVGLGELLQIEQYVPHKVYGDPYVNTSRGPGYIERNRPTSALLISSDLPVAGQVIAQTGVLAIPEGDFAKKIVGEESDYTASLTTGGFGEGFAGEPPYREVVTAGPYLYIVGQMAFDWGAGKIPDEVKVASFSYHGSEIRNETEFCLDRLREYAARVGGDLRDITHISVYLSDLGDLYEMDRIWKRYFGDQPPCRTVVHVRAQGSPRVEAPGQQHADEAPVLEHIAQGIVPGRGATREVVQTPFEPLGCESVAIKAGEQLWISHQYARLQEGDVAIVGDIDAQLAVIFDRLRTICTAAGTHLRNAVRLRAYLLDPAEGAAVAAALRAEFPTDPPTVMMAGVERDLLIPGARVAIDGIVYVPSSATR